MNDAAWTLTPAGLERVLGEIDAGRERIVECGSGLSTLAIARRLAERGAGRLYSLEHDPEWHAHTGARLESERLAQHVSLIEASLRPHRLAEPDCGWYDTAALTLLPHGVDLLLVDGPPGSLAANGGARYPALPLLAPRLAAGAVVILDDIHRPGERLVLQRWQRELGVEFELHPRERVAIGVFCEREDPAHAGMS